MDKMAIVGVLLVLYGAVVMFLTLNKPKAVWNMKKIKMFEKLLGEKGTVILFYIISIVAIVAGIWILK